MKNFNLSTKPYISLNNAPFIHTAIFLLTSVCASAQALPMHLNEDPMWLERLEIRAALPMPYHSAIKPYAESNVIDYVQSVDSMSAILGPKMLGEAAPFLREYSIWLRDSARIERRNRPGWKSWIFPVPTHLFEMRRRDFYLSIKPVLHLEAGRQQGDSLLLFANRRGIEVKGAIDQKVWFYTSLLEQQARFPDFVDERILKDGGIPGAGFYKSYASNIAGGLSGYDYNLATACVAFKAGKYVRVQLGHGKQFIGNGYRSMLLSGYSNNHFYLQTQTSIGKWTYQNLWMELTSFAANANPRQPPTGDLLPAKYAAIHYLSYRLAPRFNVGLMEGSVFANSRRFNLTYLNPVMGINSWVAKHTNVLGLNAQWDLWGHLRLYGQWVQSDFDLKFQKGWWGNKYGLQLGALYCDAFRVSNLDLRVEYNMARPYLYMAEDALNNWSHYQQPLAHPLGANFREHIIQLNYEPFKRFSIRGRALWMQGGDDLGAENWGSNLLLGTASRTRTENNRIAQGVRYDTFLAAVDISLSVAAACYLDLGLLYRNKTSTSSELNRQTTTFSAGVRYNFWRPNFDF